MAKEQFVYVTYIRTTAEALWDALTRPEFTRAYWSGVAHDTTWEEGAPWKLTFADGTVADAGEVQEVRRPERLVLRWRNEFRPELTAEGFSTCTFDLEPEGNTVKLTVTHEIDWTKSKFIEAVSGGWPKVLSSLKSLLETGQPLPAKLPGKQCAAEEIAAAKG
jgi:uncharacterized protein YndB with AHSA1/START domain